MATPRYTIRVLSTLTLWAGFGLSAAAQPPGLTVEQALAAKPKQTGVSLPAVTPADAARLRLDPIPHPQKAGASIGYVLRDGQNRPVRQFVSYTPNQFNIVAYYADGAEVYRETVPTEANQPHSYRWLGANGGKWGLDDDRNGLIDRWAVISPEEVSQELLAAVVRRDPGKLNAVLPTDKDLAALALPAAEVARIKAKAAGAGQKLAEAVAALNLSADAKWVHLELGLPQTTPADAFGREGPDLVVHKNATVLIEDKGKTHFLQTGELLKVGDGWRAVEGPAAGAGALPGGADTPSGTPPVTPEIAELVRKLHEIDANPPTPPTPAAVAAHSAKRAVVLDEVVQKLPADKQGEWARMLVDTLAAAAEGGPADGAHLARLKQLADFFGKTPGSPLGGVAAFKVLVAENNIALAKAKGGEIPAVQEKWRAGLEAFVKAHPGAEDAGEAVMRLAMAHEFAGKDGEARAKDWYAHLTKNYPQHPQANKAAGAVRRLEAEGKPLALDGPVLGTGQAFSAAQLAGKPVVVFYWASWSTSLAEDAKRLQALAAAYGPKGLEIVTVSLDDDAKAAADAARAAGLPGTHLHAPGGLDGSPLAVGYGVMVVPHVIVAGKDGKVTNRAAQVATLDEDLKKLVP